MRTSSMILSIFTGLFLLAVIACQSKSKELTAQEIVDRAIEVVGGATIANSSIAFKFRDYHYRAKRQGGEYQYERCTDENCEERRDILDNAGFERFEQLQAVPLPDSLQSKYGNSVNSVHYFSVLPYGLNAAAVNKTLKGKTTVHGKEYYLIGVTFAREGGGDDYDDEYVYWISTEDFTVDYLAYNYQVNGGGTRFREAYNPRVIEGIRFVDYRNYKPEATFPPLESLDSLYETDQLELLSKIELENISVAPCPAC
ncbi:DUF6503 family protein [Croceiramulus getboli]|nr:deoxyribose-phosphate aldolase [Flavobacteriaceae bacterium YJPT1-3]